MSSLTSRIIRACVLSAALASAAAVAAEQGEAAQFDPPENARVTDRGWFDPPQRAIPLPELPDEVTKAFIIPLRETITSKTEAAMRRKFIRCIAQGAELIIIDMDTPGGAVNATMEINKLIKSELRDIRVVTFIRTDALSGGAFVAMAGNEIVMTPVGRIGGAAPVMMGGELEGVTREKIESYLRAEMEESARLNGYWGPPAQSMVSMDLEVWLVRNRETGELRYVFREDWRDRVGQPQDGATDQQQEGSDPEWELVEVAVREGQLLTADTAKAEEFGFVADVVNAPSDDPYAELLARYNVTKPPTILEDTWSERMVGVLVSPPVMGIMFFAALLCAYVEVNTPGFGVAGSIAVVLFGLIFGGHLLVGLANWWSIALFVVGVILILIEVFALPDFGIAGIVGALMCVVGLIAMLVPSPPDRLPIPQTDLQWEMLTNGMLALGIGFVGALVAAGILSRYMPKVPVARKVILAEPTPATGEHLHETSPYARIQPGAQGRVESMCRPVGRARFGDELVDVVTEGETIESGTPVRVLYRQGNRLVVERAEPPEEGD